VLNPYAMFLDGQDVQNVLSQTPARLASIFANLGPHGSEKPPAPGKWNAREIFCHLADCEIVFAYRLRQTLAEENHLIQPFDQDMWATTYGSYDAPSALAVFSSVRRWNLALIKNVLPENLSKSVTHPERGAMTFQTVLETMAGHDLNHLQQLDAIVS
jgi:hypothetical protein